MDMIDTKIRRLDTTAILVFVGLVHHGRTTVVAERLRLTQSAISQTLKRLRALLDDPLFIRRPRGLQPTDFALAVAPRFVEIVELMREAVTGPAPFDPAASRREIRIAAGEYESAAIVPRLLAITAEKAPLMRLHTLPLTGPAAVSALESGGIDVALGFHREPGADVVATTLYDEHYVVVARADHPLFSNRLTSRRYAAARHLLVTPDGARRGLVDEALAARGLARAVVASVPLFLPAFATLAGGDLVATLPSELARAFCPLFGLAMRPLPFAVHPFPVSALHHRRNHRDGPHRWLVETLRTGLART